jgi:hypothetical protein
VTRRRPSLLEPSRLQPVELDLLRVFWGGVLAWTVALLVTAVLAALGQVEPRTVATCAAGIALGLLAVRWERRRRGSGRT